MEARADRRMTAAEFFEWQQTQELRYELIAGVPVLRVKSPWETDPRMMAGASPRHALIASNLGGALNVALASSPCESYQSDAGALTAEDNVRLPDVVVDCAEEIATTGFLTDPVVVVEILSRSTRQFDLRQKLDEYKSVTSIQTIVFVEQEFIDVEVHSRQAGNAWTTTRLTSLNDVLAFDTLGVAIPLAVVYRRAPVGERPRPTPYLKSSNGPESISG